MGDYAHLSDLADICMADGEFMLAARHWNGGLCLIMEKKSLFISLNQGKPSTRDPGSGDGVITISGTEENWQALLTPVQQRLRSDIKQVTFAGLDIQADDVLLAKYSAAVMRVIELLRPANSAISRLQIDPKLLEIYMAI